MTGTEIVVGYDGSPGAEQALAWAAREARCRRSALTVCLARTPAYPGAPPGNAQSGVAPGGEEALIPGLQLARDLMADGEVRPLIAAGPPAAVLCERSATAGMVVVGCRGRGGLPGLPIGSVALQVAAHARGRIVVVRGEWQPVPGLPPLPVAVGSDGSPASDAAVRFGFEEAGLRGTRLLAVCALADDPAVLSGARQIANDFERLISRHEQQHPDIAVRRQVSEGSARHALLEAAAGAQMLVVGARGRGGFADMSLGSVGMAMACYASCPVGVVHDDQ
ncbi:MAG TPA: universal stress protein [Streptosporangiaceae bacterium]|nr:universal stress protein [Streptosporangiaceae bacterium]